jgi:hypothetical protein
VEIHHQNHESVSTPSHCSILNKQSEPLAQHIKPIHPPLLSKEKLQAVGSGFLKIQPMAISDAALFASDDDNA